MRDALTVTEAAERLGVSRVTVWRMIQRGELIAYKIGGRWILEAGDVARYLDRVRNVPRQGEGNEQGTGTD